VSASAYNYMQNKYSAILSYTGTILIITSMLFITPLFLLMFYPFESGQSAGFVLPMAGLAGLGFILRTITRKRAPVVLNVQEGSIIVLLSWIVVCIFSALPLMINCQLNFTQAIFESVSGWTTTGLSVVDVTKVSHLVLFWRSIMQFAGGAGLVIIMLSAIAGPPGPGLSLAEGRTDLLVPHVQQSAKLVMIIYVSMIFIGTLLYILAGMSAFDAINHSIAALSTGGFSTRVESIGYWNSPAIELITIILMIIGNINFLTIYLLINRNFKAFIRNGEIRLSALLILVSFIILLFFVTIPLYDTLSSSLRVAIFEGVSALTTTGYTITTYSNWNTTGYFVLIILMLIGGGTCSTAGGLKQYRVYLMYKLLRTEFKRALLPRSAVITPFIWQGDRKEYINDNYIRQLISFVFLFICVYAVGVLILSFYGYRLEDAMFEFASSLSDVGLSAGITKSDAPAVVLWTETIGMFLGRLEIFVIFTSSVKLFKDLFLKI